MHRVALSYQHRVYSLYTTLRHILLYCISLYVHVINATILYCKVCHCICNCKHPLIHIKTFWTYIVSSSSDCLKDSYQQKGMIFNKNFNKISTQLRDWLETLQQCQHCVYTCKSRTVCMYIYKTCKFVKAWSKQTLDCCLIELQRKHHKKASRYSPDFLQKLVLLQP